MIEIVNERLRTQKEVVLGRKYKGLSSILFALRWEIEKDGKSSFERHKRHNINTLKSAMINGHVPENDPNLDRKGLFLP